MIEWLEILELPLWCLLIYLLAGPVLVRLLSGRPITMWRASQIRAVKEEILERVGSGGLTASMAAEEFLSRCGAYALRREPRAIAEFYLRWLHTNRLQMEDNEDE